MIFPSVEDVNKIIKGTKTQTRRKTPIYNIGETYSISVGRQPGISDGKIRVIDKRIEKYSDGGISVSDARAEGGYSPGTFESFFQNRNPRWIVRYAYTFEFVPFLPSRVFPNSRDRSYLEERIGDNLAQCITEEYCLSHGLYNNTVEARVYVEIQEPNGKRWKAERVIKMRLRRIWEKKV